MLSLEAAATGTSRCSHCRRRLRPPTPSSRATTATTIFGGQRLRHPAPSTAIDVAMASAVASSGCPHRLQRLSPSPPTPASAVTSCSHCSSRRHLRAASPPSEQSPSEGSGIALCLYSGLRAESVFGLRATVACRPASQGYSWTVHCLADPYRAQLLATGASYSSSRHLPTPHDCGDSISTATSSSIHPRAPPRGQEIGATWSLVAGVVDQKTSDDLVNTGDNSSTWSWGCGQLSRHVTPAGKVEASTVDGSGG
ncbi:uncharacterized protein LOC122023399 [Zingiber officinale]|uniref:uncharacterized protein LOC122023399 n=1 Tax=Zingiber officinale TaxID=94328 RepID=UPI001C4C2BAE|nr:uncharacterized protein LOC122023399 [Zingiber officinale]XP_042437424.1 uncharacterized protein LOC122023399 [Zingiber officinale]